METVFWILIGIVLSPLVISVGFTLVEIVTWADDVLTRRRRVAYSKKTLREAALARGRQR